MKKFSFFASALLFSASMVAQLTWAPLEFQNDIIKSNSKACGRSDMDKVLVTADGDVFLLAHSASMGVRPTVTFGVNSTDSFLVEPFAENQSQTNTNMVFVKTDKSLKAKWVGTTDRGYFYSDYGAVLTAEGGVVVAVKARHSEKNRIGDNKVMEFLGTNDTKAEFVEPYTTDTWYGAIVEYDAQGVPTIRQKFYQMEGQTDGFIFNNMVTDGSNYYVLSVLKPGLVIGEDTITTGVASSKDGSTAVLKFDKDFAYVGCVVTDSVPFWSSSLCDLQYVDGKIYVFGQLSTTNSAKDTLVGKSLCFGDKKLVVPENNSVLCATLSTDLQCEHLSVVKGVKDGKSCDPKVYHSVIVGNYAYIAGTIKGGLETSAGVFMGVNATAYHAYAIKVDMTSGECTHAVGVESEKISANPSILFSHDSIYMYYYDWTDNKIYLQSYDQNLNKGTQHLLVSYKSLTSTTPAVFCGNDLIYSFSERYTCTFAADTTQTYTTQNELYTAMTAVQQLFEEASGVEEVRDSNKTRAVKFVKDGQVYIRKGDKVYNILGVEC